MIPSNDWPCPKDRRTRELRFKNVLSCAHDQTRKEGRQRCSRKFSCHATISGSMDQDAPSAKIGAKTDRSEQKCQNRLPPEILPAHLPTQTRGEVRHGCPKANQTNGVKNKECRDRHAYRPFCFQKGITHICRAYCILKKTKKYRLL